MLAKLAIKLRTMQLYYHFCHNFARGPVFMQDHAAFNEFYDEATDDYDAVIENAMVKEGDEVVCPKMQLKSIYGRIKELKCVDAESDKVLFEQGLMLEKELCTYIEDVKQSGVSLGCETLIGDVAARSEVRQYKIGQRIR